MVQPQAGEVMSEAKQMVVPWSRMPDFQLCVIDQASEVIPLHQHGIFVLLSRATEDGVETEKVVHVTDSTCIVETVVHLSRQAAIYWRNPTHVAFELIPPPRGGATVAYLVDLKVRAARLENELRRT